MTLSIRLRGPSSPRWLCREGERTHSFIPRTRYKEKCTVILSDWWIHFSSLFIIIWGYVVQSYGEWVVSYVWVCWCHVCPILTFDNMWGVITYYHCFSVSTYYIVLNFICIIIFYCDLCCYLFKYIYICIYLYLLLSCIVAAMWLDPSLFLLFCTCTISTISTKVILILIVGGETETDIFSWTSTTSVP